MQNNSSYNAIIDEDEKEENLETFNDYLKCKEYREKKNNDYIPVVTSFSGYTDTAVIASELKSGETLSYGPGSLSLAHKPDEYVEINDILRCEEVYRNLADYLLK